MYSFVFVAYFLKKKGALSVMPLLGNIKGLILNIILIGLDYYTRIMHSRKNI